MRRCLDSRVPVNEWISECAQFYSNHLSLSHFFIFVFLFFPRNPCLIKWNIYLDVYSLHAFLAQQSLPIHHKRCMSVENKPSRGKTRIREQGSRTIQEFMPQTCGKKAREEKKNTGNYPRFRRPNEAVFTNYLLIWWRPFLNVFSREISFLLLFFFFEYVFKL